MAAHRRMPEVPVHLVVAQVHLRAQEDRPAAVRRRKPRGSLEDSLGKQAELVQQQAEQVHRAALTRVAVQLLAELPRKQVPRPVRQARQMAVAVHPVERARPPEHKAARKAARQGVLMDQREHPAKVALKRPAKQPAQLAEPVALPARVRKDQRMAPTPELAQPGKRVVWQAAGR